MVRVIEIYYPHHNCIFLTYGAGNVILSLMPSYVLGVCMSSLVGRKEYKRSLEYLYNSDQAEFLALYGRRRVGKTFLITQFFSEKQCVFMHVTGIKDGDAAQQMARVTKAMSDAFYGGIALKEYSSWFDMFDALVYAIKHFGDPSKKIVLFFDEFPWMVTHRSKLLQALDHFWNHYWSMNPRIKLVICGSSASWIIRNIIGNKGGLHNRVTKKMLLKPFVLSEVKAYLESRNVKLNHWHVTQIYMLTGGVPFYLSFIKQGRSATQVIEQLAFRQDAPLLKEFEYLFSSLFTNAEPYIELLRILAKHRYGLSIGAIADASSSFAKGGHLMDKLQELQEAGFILAFKPYQHRNRGTYWRVIDEYTLFYFHWIEHIVGDVQEASLEPGYWRGQQDSAAFRSWSGLAFETMVYKHISHVRFALDIPVTSLANTWRYSPKAHSKEQGAQIDLLFDQQDDVVTLCEIKYTTKPFVVTKKIAQDFMKKKAVFVEKTRCKKQVFIVLISANGMSDNPYSDALISACATLEDLFVERPT